MSTTTTRVADAETQTDPHQRLDGYTLFRDDELAMIAYAASTSFGPTQYQAGILLPDGTYNLQAGPAASLPAALNTQQAAYDALPVARGRFVDSNADQAVVLTKVNINMYAPPNFTISWALQGIQVQGDGAVVPPCNFLTTPESNINAPGAIAAGDLDLAVDANGNFHDEVAIVVEDINRQLVLMVIDYAVQPGQATATTLIPNVTLDYLTNPFNAAFCDPPNDGNIPIALQPTVAVAIGDFNADGRGEIAVAYVAQLQLWCAFYTYAVDPVNGAALQPIGKAVPVCPLSAWSRLQMAHGDFDGDGKEEVALFYRTWTMGQHDSYQLQQTLSIVTGPYAAGGPSPVLTQVLDGMTVKLDGKWDMENARSVFTYPIFSDLGLAAGLFKYDPEDCYSLTRRQLVVGYMDCLHNGGSPYSGGLVLQLLDVASPNSPPPAAGGSAPAQWQCTAYSSASLVLAVSASDYTPSNQLGLTARASFALVAGAFAGTRSNPLSPLWGVAVACRLQQDQNNPQFTIQLGRVDGSQPGQLTFGTPAHFPQIGTDCGLFSRCALLAFDYDGHAVLLGPPIHYQLVDSISFDAILEEPPQHLDYLPNVAGADPSGLLNISRVQGFATSCTDKSGTTFSVKTTSESSFTVGGSVESSASGTAGLSLDIVSASVTQSLTTKVQYDYTDNQSNYTGNEFQYNLDLNSATMFDDVVSYSIRTTDIWRYPVYGVSGDPQLPFTYYELALPNACTTTGNVAGMSAPVLPGTSVSFYQPTHENGNVLSYPVQVANEPLALPADLGSWQTPTASGVEEKATPLAGPQQMSWGSNSEKSTAEVSISQVQGGSRQYTNKLNAGIDYSYSPEVSFFGLVKAKASINISFNTGITWSRLSTSSSKTTESQSLSIVMPGASSTNYAYYFYPTMYVSQTGALKVSMAAGADDPASAVWWKNTYTLPDPALNLPGKYVTNQTSYTNFFWEFNAAPEGKKLRGFFLRSVDANNQPADYLAAAPTAGDKVCAEVRVYNYSLGASADNVSVRFDYVEVDANDMEIGTRTVLGTTTATFTDPSSGAVGNSIPPCAFGTAIYIVDTTALAPTAGAGSAMYRIYVVVDPDAKIQQTHGWHVDYLTITPSSAGEPGDVFTVTVQDAKGTTLCSASYTSTGDILDLLSKLYTNLGTALTAANLSNLLVNYSPNQVAPTALIVSIANAQLKPSTEFRCGVFDPSGNGYFFIPAVQSHDDGAQMPILAVSNDELGQNNEGWGEMTVFAPSQPSVGKAVTQGTHADVRLHPQGLAARDGTGRVKTGQVKVKTGRPLRLRISAVADADSPKHEYVEVLLAAAGAEPQVIALQHIRGVSAARGGHTWWTCTAPTTPGEYTLSARLVSSARNREAALPEPQLTLLVS